jgi:hypothetical protein
MPFLEIVILPPCVIMLPCALAVPLALLDTARHLDSIPVRYMSFENPLFLSFNLSYLFVCKTQSLLEKGNLFICQGFQ